MDKVTTLEYNKEDSESVRQEKNRILVDREVFICFSYPMQELLEKEVISFEDMENLYLSYEQIKESSLRDWDKIGDEEEEIQAIRDNGEDMQEIYEYYIVSEWFYDKLKQLNEPVIEWAGVYIWGRTCTGQSICLDYTIDEIRKLLK